MNAKNAERDREIEKLKIVLKEYEENKLKYESKIGKITEQLNNKNTQVQQLTEAYRQTKKRLQYLEFKFENIAENRNLFEQGKTNEEEDEAVTKKKIKTEVYNEFNRIIVKKIDYFTTDLKRMSMSSQVEQRI